MVVRVAVGVVDGASVEDCVGLIELCGCGAGVEVGCDCGAGVEVGCDCGAGVEVGCDCGAGVEGGCDGPDAGAGVEVGCDGPETGASANAGEAIAAATTAAARSRGRVAASRRGLLAVPCPPPR